MNISVAELQIDSAADIGDKIDLNPMLNGTYLNGFKVELEIGADFYSAAHNGSERYRATVDGYAICPDCDVWLGQEAESDDITDIFQIGAAVHSAIKMVIGKLDTATKEHLCHHKQREIEMTASGLVDD